MRTASAARIALETAREPEKGWLIHIFARRDGPYVRLPEGWGSWCYSLGFAGNVTFTDLADYTGEGVLERTYAPGSIQFDVEQILRRETLRLDPSAFEMVVNAADEPFLHYVNRRWPLTFGIVVYRVFRDGNAVKVVDDEVMAEVRFVGFLDNEEDSIIEEFENETKRYRVRWDSLMKLLGSDCPRAIHANDCPKTLFSTGRGAIVDCNASKDYVRVEGVVVQVSGLKVRAEEWGDKPNAWFAQGLIEYDAVDPVSGLTFSFSIDIVASERIGSGAYGDLTAIMRLPLLQEGDTVQAFGGCDRKRGTCITKHLPLGVAPPGGPGSGTLQFALQTKSSTFVHIQGDELWVHTEGAIAEDLVVNSADWDATWVGHNTDPHYSPLGDPLPAAGRYDVRISSVGDREVTIYKQPREGNDWELILHCKNGGYCEARVLWGDATDDGNLRNFGGADIPVEHPSFENAP